MAATQHWRKRVAERIGPDVDPDTLAETLILALQQERYDLVEFVTRVNRDGQRMFRFRALNGRFYFALIDTDNHRCITVMPPGFVIARQGKPRLQLKDSDL